jgi:glutathione synthase/RimK-type ligase-like ATP-grasp enzyme
MQPWLNHPHRLGYAEYKPVQLHTAARCGLRVPRTFVGNDPAAARSFVADVGEAVYKPFGGGGIRDTDGAHQLFSTLVTPEQAGSLSVAQTMHLFQEWVPKDYEVRLTVVDDQFFAARIDAGSEEGYLDWRADYQRLTYSTVETPEPVRTQVSALLNTLGLRFGALDFAVTPDNQWHFLELNPNGQWAWIEEETGMPIAATLADALEGRRDR